METTAKVQNWDVKWIILLKRRKKCEKWHEREVMNCRVTSSIKKRETSKIYCDVLYTT